MKLEVAQKLVKESGEISNQIEQFKNLLDSVKDNNRIDIEVSNQSIRSYKGNFEFEQFQKDLRDLLSKTIYIMETRIKEIEDMFKGTKTTTVEKL
jgi:hypothetical protein